MNTLMYEHPITAEHLRVVKDVIRYEIVGPIGKTLACGDVGRCVCGLVEDGSSLHDLQGWVL